MIIKKGEEHKHKFEKVETVVALRQYEKTAKGLKPGLISARDVLKQRKCECGVIETYDLERHKGHIEPAH